MSNDWLPADLNRKAETVGGISSDGTFHPSGQHAHRAPNKLMGSSDPIIQRIGVFTFTAPAKMPSDIATFAGILLGLTFADLFPDLVKRILDGIQVDPLPSGLDHNITQDIVRSWVNGTDN